MEKQGQDRDSCDWHDHQSSRMDNSCQLCLSGVITLSQGRHITLKEFESCVV
jgi:hypothetical protein